MQNDLQHLRQCLITACNAARNRGMRIKPYHDGKQFSNCCCPIGALNGATGTHGVTVRYATKLDGMSTQVRWSIVRGFDQGATSNDAESLGNELREMFT